MVKVKFIGKSSPYILLYGIIYNVLSIENKWYRLIYETGENYLYPPNLFELSASELVKIKQTIRDFTLKFSII